MAQGITASREANKRHTTCVESNIMSVEENDSYGQHENIQVFRTAPVSPSSEGNRPRSPSTRFSISVSMVRMSFSPVCIIFADSVESEDVIKAHGKEKNDDAIVFEGGHDLLRDGMMTCRAKHRSETKSNDYSGTAKMLYLLCFSMVDHEDDNAQNTIILLSSVAPHRLILAHRSTSASEG